MITAVIPFLNEERALAATLDRVFGSALPLEVIAVDAGSTDRSREILRRYPVRVIDAERGRAQQMNAGAAIAGGDVLLFLHADTLLPRNALAKLCGSLADPSVQWGGFHQSFSDADWRLRLVSTLHNWRCRATGVFYGDQTLFVRRSLFERAGGFPAGLMEDIAISERLLRLARPTFLDAAVITDSRKFVQMGVWKSLARVVAILACRQFRLPIPPAFFANVR